MALHPRQAIREAVKTALVSAGTSAGARVYETRMTPFRAVKLPAIAVYVLNESSTLSQAAPREIERKAQLEIVGAVRATDDVDDALDALALEIETAMHADETFGGLAGDSFLSSTEIGIESEGDKPIGMVSMTYEVTYHSEIYATEPLDRFDTAGIRYDQANAQATADEASDLLTEINEE